MQRTPNAVPDFDRGVERLPPLLLNLHAAIGLQAHPNALGHTVLLFGWSVACGRMACASFSSLNDYAAELHATDSNAMVFWRNPDLPREKYQWPPSDAPELIAFAQATVEHHRGIDPTVPIGGKLILAKLTQQSVTLSVAGDLGMPS